MPHTLTWFDRLRVERLIWSLDQRLYELPPRTRIAHRREVRANLLTAAAEVGAGEALRRLGSAHELAAQYLDAELGEGARHSWLAAALFALTTPLVLNFFLSEAANAYEQAITAPGTHADGSYTWGGVTWLQSPLTFRLHEGQATHVGGAWTPLVYVLLLAGTVACGRLWRALPGRRNQRRAGSTRGSLARPDPSSGRPKPLPWDGPTLPGRIRQLATQTISAPLGQAYWQSVNEERGWGFPRSLISSPGASSASLGLLVDADQEHVGRVDAHEVNRLRAALAMFVADVFASVPRTDQRAKGECYLRGLMLDGRRKSIQPMAERLPDGNMQALQQFVNQSPWDPLPVRQRIAERLSQVVKPEVWVIDDVSFPKCGKASVGVARQYCGAVGKRANCQVAVSVHAATDTASRPLEWQLYLPREWTDEPDRCRRAGAPEDVVHREKWRLALGLLDTLAQWQLEAPVVVADAGYGVSTPFRLGLQERGLSYVLALQGKEVAHPEDAEPHQPVYGGLGPPTLPRYRTPPRAISTLAAQAGAKRFIEVTWRQGSKGAMTSRFTVLTVRPAGKQSLAAAQEAGGGRNRWDGVLPVQTLLVEWPDGQDAPTNYWISNLPATTPAADLVRWAKMRWRIEHDYRELKYGLGLDHFEGRTWRGWHHHVTLVTAAQAFLTLRRLDPKVEAPPRASTRPSTHSKTY